jgi:thioredoxin reductase (NADPH)
MSDTETPIPTPDRHVLIAGGGASGMTCALFLARAGLTVTVMDQNRSILKRGLLHNYPGVPPVVGNDWLAYTKGLLDGFDKVRWFSGRIDALKATENGFVAETAGDPIAGDLLVIASGQTPTPFIDGLGLNTVDPIQPYVQTNIVVDKWGKTNVEGVYACGVVAGFPSQAVITAGTGAMVAIGIINGLRGEFWVDHDEV